MQKFFQPFFAVFRSAATRSPPTHSPPYNQNDPQAKGRIHRYFLDLRYSKRHARRRFLTCTYPLLYCAGDFSIAIPYKEPRQNAVTPCIILPAAPSCRLRRGGPPRPARQELPYCNTKKPPLHLAGATFGTPGGNRTHNGPLGGGCYIHLTTEAFA